MGWKKNLLKGSKVVADIFVPEVVNLGAKIGSDIYEQQKALVKIPDLKDVLIEDAMRILRDELHLIPTMAIANPNVAYADESDNEVMYSEPRFGSRVSPGAAIKVYYVTQEVIEKSKVLLKNAVTEFKVPIVVGLNIYEAREDLEELGLRVTEKLENPSPNFVNKGDGQVTKLTFPNGQKVGSKLKTGDRIFLYYVNDEVIFESKSLKDKNEKEKQEMIDNIGKVTKDITNGLSSGAKDVSKNLANTLANPFGKKRDKGDENIK